MISCMKKNAYLCTYTTTYAHILTILMLTLHKHYSTANRNRVARYQHLSLLIASNLYFSWNLLNISSAIILSLLIVSSHYFSWNLLNISLAIISCLPSQLMIGSKYFVRTRELGEPNCVLGCTPSLTIIISVSLDHRRDV